MSQTLGEKLRQAREERGISISDVAEQTRISSHYLECIENDDYRTLPGGIFNKGFVKSYAKFVDVDEQEALAGYTKLITQNDIQDEPSLKIYKPEVLTDERGGRSMIPTIIGAVIILGLMTGGILFLKNYLENRPDRPAANAPAANTSQAGNSNSGGPGGTTNGTAPEMSAIKVEFKALSNPVSLSITTDGKNSNQLVAAGSSVSFEPKESLKLSYSRSLAQVVQLSINGRSITLPAVPFVPTRKTIELEINKDNLAKIWNSGTFSADVPAANPDANIAPPATTGQPQAPAQPRSTPVVKPTTAANTPAKPSPKPPEPSKSPAATPKKTP